METYTLIVLVALFLGVMGIVAMLEHRRRKDLAQFEQLQQKLTQIADALSQLRATVEEGTAEAQRTTKAVKDLQASMEASVDFTK